MFNNITNVLSWPEISIRQIRMSVDEFPNTIDDTSAFRLFRKRFRNDLWIIQTQCAFECHYEIQNVTGSICVVESTGRDKGMVLNGEKKGEVFWLVIL